MYRRSMTLGAMVAAALGAGVIMSEPAAARAYCIYQADDALGRVMATGHATAAKMSWACNRAERRCKRALKNKGRPYRGCHRVGQAR